MSNDKAASQKPTMDVPTDWTFRDTGVADGFDSHVREQLPWYDVVTRAVAGIVAHYLPSEGGLIYDLGASTGNVGRAVNDLLTSRNARLIAIEESQNMADVYDGPGELSVTKIEDHPYEPFDVAVAVLSIMFIPVRERAGLIDRLRRRCIPGGAIVVVDRCLPREGYAAQVFWRMTLDAKLSSGTDPADVIKKEMSLRGIQRGIDPSLLGDDAIEFFRFGDFAGWIIESHDRSGGDTKNHNSFDVV